MSKKPKRNLSNQTEKTVMEAMTEMRDETPPAPITKPPPRLTSDLLKDVRIAALKMSADVSHNIAELESWRNEIDATIAFLRSQQK